MKIYQIWCCSVTAILIFSTNLIRTCTGRFHTTPNYLTRGTAKNVSDVSIVTRSVHSIRRKRSDTAASLCLPDGVQILESDVLYSQNNQRSVEVHVTATRSFTISAYVHLNDVSWFHPGPDGFGKSVTSSQLGIYPGRSLWSQYPEWYSFTIEASIVQGYWQLRFISKYKWVTEQSGEKVSKNRFVSLQYSVSPIRAMYEGGAVHDCLLFSSRATTSPKPPTTTIPKSVTMTTPISPPNTSTVKSKIFTSTSSSYSTTNATISTTAIIKSSTSLKSTSVSSTADLETWKVPFTTLQETNTFENGSDSFTVTRNPMNIHQNFTKSEATNNFYDNVTDQRINEYANATSPYYEYSSNTTEENLIINVSTIDKQENFSSTGASVTEVYIIPSGIEFTRDHLELSSTSPMSLNHDTTLTSNVQSSTIDKTTKIHDSTADTNDIETTLVVSTDSITSSYYQKEDVSVTNSLTTDEKVFSNKSVSSNNVVTSTASSYPSTSAGTILQKHSHIHF